MDALVIFDDEFLRHIYDNPYNVIPRRYLRDFDNPLECYSDGDFIKRYRFSKRTVRDLILPMIPVGDESQRGLPIPPQLKVLTALRFYASGSFQYISIEITRKLPEWVKLPLTEGEITQHKIGFHEISRFPGVVGCIDCTYIPIQNPVGDHGELYRNRNRKGWFSMNVQVVVGPSYEIVNLVCRWHGSVYDARIFHNSRLKFRFESGQLKGLLLGL